MITYTNYYKLLGKKAGPVGPGDRIGNYTNKDLIMRSCNAEGLLLKPSKPITSIDQQMYAKALGASYGPEGEVWSTFSNISNNIFGILFAADIKSPSYQITPKNIGFTTNVNYISTNYIRRLAINNYHISLKRTTH